MSSYPTVRPSPPLEANFLQPPPQQPDLIGEYGRILQLRNMLQMQPLQQQAAQQGVQSQGLQIQQQQQQLKDQQAMTAAMQQWDGKDYNDMIPLVIKNGGSAQAVMGLKSKVLEQQQAISTTLKNNADAGLAQVTAQKDRNDQIAGALTPLIDPKQVPDAQLPQAVMSTAQDLVQRGLLDPQHAQTAQQIANSGDPVAIRSQLDMLRKGFMAQSQIVDEGLKAAQTNLANTQNQVAQQNLRYGPIGPAAEARYRDILSKAASGQPLSQDDTQFAQGFEASQTKSTATSDSLGVVSNNTSRPSGLAAAISEGRRNAAAPSAGSAPASVAPTSASSNSASALSPADLKGNLVDMIGQYRQDPASLSRLISRHPDILALVQAKYPDFDQTTYEAKNKLIQGYTSGPQSREINAINTAMGHVKVLDDAVSALNNGNVQALNAIGNKLGAATGSTPQTTFQAIVHRVGPEITSAYIPGAGGESERLANEQDFSENLAPQQLHDNAAITVKLLRSKVGALENQYQNTVGRNDFTQRFITPEAQSAFQKFSGGGGAGGSVMMRAPNGQMKAVSPDQVDHYTQLGAKVVQ